MSRVLDRRTDGDRVVEGRTTVRAGIVGALVLAGLVAVGPVFAPVVGRAPGFADATGILASARHSELGSSGSVTFGLSVAVSDGTVVVGDSGVAQPTFGASSGRGYVFAKVPAGWRRAAELKLRGPGLPLGNGFGRSVAASGMRIVIGAQFGPAYVFTKTASGWRQAAELESAGPATGVEDNFGASVAVSGTTVLVGAPAVDFAGRAYVFSETASGWHQTAEIKGNDTVTDDGFGLSVAISGGVIVVGASGHAAAAGRAYVFTRTIKGWHQTAELKGSDTVEGDNFGESVAISGNTVVVGAPNHAADAGFTCHQDYERVAPNGRPNGH